MSGIVNRRVLMEAAQRLVKANAPDLEDYMAVSNALAQVMTDDMGVPCRLVLRVSQQDIERALGAAS
jgi:hypothetical protein